MDRSLDSVGSLHPGQLDLDHYAFSLLRKGERAGAISSQEALQIQGRIMEELAATVLRYTRGESSSVKEETARELMASLVCTIDRFLLSLLYPNVALTALKEQEMSELREKGAALLREDVAKAKALLEAISTARVVTDLLAYNDTLDALPEFFEHYDVLYAAHDIPCSIDYPLSREIRGQGVTYIGRYLRTLETEERFCRCFDKSEINALVRASSFTMGMEGKDLLINLFELAFDSCVFSLLSSGEGRPRLLSAGECEELFLKLSSLSGMQVNFLCEEAVNRLCSRFAPGDADLEKHLIAYGKKFARELSAALKAGDIRPMVLRKSEVAPPVRYRDGEKMEDEALRDLIEEIRGAPSPEKIALLGRVKSLTDFAEILGAGLLYGQELERAFSLLDAAALAMLFKRDGIFDLDSDDFPPEEGWQGACLQYVKRLPIEQQKAVAEWMLELE